MWVNLLYKTLRDILFSYIFSSSSEILFYILQEERTFILNFVVKQYICKLNGNFYPAWALCWRVLRMRLELDHECLMRSRFQHKNRILYLFIFDLRPLKGKIIVLTGKCLLKMGKLDLKKIMDSKYLKQFLKRNTLFKCENIWLFFFYLPVVFLISISMKSPDML